MIHASALLDLRQVVDGTDHVGQGDLGILVEVTAAVHVALQIDANRGAFSACTGEAHHHPAAVVQKDAQTLACLLYTSPSPRDYAASRMPSSA